MKVFRVWTRSLGSSSRVRVEGSDNAQWLIAPEPIVHLQEQRADLGRRDHRLLDVRRAVRLAHLAFRARATARHDPGSEHDARAGIGEPVRAWIQGDRSNIPDLIIAAIAASSTPTMSASTSTYSTAAGPLSSARKRERRRTGYSLMEMVLAQKPTP